MDVIFSRKQYRDLLIMAYLGNWMINGIRIPGQEIKRFNDLEQYLFSFAKEAGFGDLVEWSEEFNQYFPTRKFDENPELDEYKEGYEEDAFWDLLTNRLGRRDFEKYHNKKVRSKMEFIELINKEQSFIDKYADEFEKNGLNNLELRK